MDTYVCLTVLAIVAVFQVQSVTTKAVENENMQKLHFRMRRSELEEYFGVSSYDKVPDYDVAAPFQTDENGNFVSHEFLLHAKHKRSTEEPNAWYFNIKAFGMFLHLNLTRNKDFLAPDLRIERHQNGSVNYEDVPQDSFLRGHVNSVPGSSVSISHDHGLMGIIQLMDQTLFLQPLANHLLPGKSSKGKAHLVFRRSVDNEISNATQSSTIGLGDMPFLDANEIIPRHYYLQIGLVADKNVILAHGVDRTKSLLMRLAFLLNHIYQHHSIGRRKITIKLSLMQLVQDGLDYGPSPSNPSRLKALSEWTNTKLNVPVSKRPDVMSLVSRGGVGGLADYNRICKSTCFTVCNDVGLQTIGILAHETAHTLGVGHDHQAPTCPNGKFIMATSLPGGPLALKWSPCSRDRIQALLSTSPQCLMDGARQRVTYLGAFKKDMPGVAANADEQCKMEYGEGFSHCIRSQSNCGSLYCTSDGGYTCLSKVAPPLDGTRCAPRRWCISGECVDDGTTKTDGGWSPWSRLVECTRTCGGGIQWRQRTCTNPKPKDGGEQCDGDSKGFYRICGQKPCPANATNYRTEQCRELNPEYLSFFYRGEKDACNLYCRFEKYYSPKGWVKDGTKCQSNGGTDVCIGGKCMSVGCNNVIGSGLEFDRCGVCNGDSSSCLEIIKEFNETHLVKGVENAKVMHVVPKKSRRIWVYEKAADRNVIAIKDAQGNLLIKPGGRGGRFQAAGARAVYGKRDYREFFFIDGPTTDDLKFLFVYRGSPNQGVVFKYLKAARSKISPDDVYWSFDETAGWTTCSDTCAGGLQTRIVKCKRKDDNSTVADAVCKTSRPDVERPCNTQPCPPEWHISAWTACSTSCGNGQSTRRVACKQKVKNPAEFMELDEDKCQQPKPDQTVQKCFLKHCPAEWVASEWGECSKSCVGGMMARTKSCKVYVGGDEYSDLPDASCKKAAKPPLREACNVDILCKAEGFNFEGELATILDHLVEVETALGLEQAFKAEFATL
ncbi:A disintegrin and metalloproteinase with thrombospondin motifs 6-like isoform X2 [Montipora capricornis]|uniref:A disintegrin and metalloproteinase with thrombospondin motifs 6-like isoform X2 n=1 Tax=Montipora capricornis TaxID=246305 RepID=UPI0035F11F89